MLLKLIKKSLIDRFDNYVDTQIYNTWLSRYEIIKNSGRQPFIPDMPEKYFSQNDEDGYMLKIHDRFNGLLKTFVEIGVGNGLENNTLILKANGLKGIWIDAQNLPKNIGLNPSSQNFRFVNEFVTGTSVNKILEDQLRYLKTHEFDVFSLDIDGDDLSVLDAVTSRFRPKVIIAEVNSKLGPSSRWNYSTKTKSTPGGDNFGMSFLTLKETLCRKNYKYLAMNAATGLNAFFIAEEHSNLFPELSSSIQFIPPYYRWPRKMFGTPSFELVESILNG